MCGRYLIEEDDIKIRQIIDEAVKNSGIDAKTGEIFPTNNAPIIVKSQDKTVPTVMQWGFPNFKNKGVIINARAETALEKRLFRDSLLFRRCVIPTSGFYEWKKVSGKNKKDKYLFKLSKEPLVYIAGFYKEYKVGGLKDNRFVILTTKANSSMKDTHDRMPIVLEKESIYDWINSNKAFNFLDAIPPYLTKSLVL